MSEKKQEEGENEKIRPNQWMLRPCEWYQEEYNDCKSFRARFNQYFVDGKYLDCSQWKIDHKNCNAWKSSDDDESYNALLASERKRRLERLKPHFNNNTWTKRDKPPENWNKPLPEWLEKRQRFSYLSVKQKDLETGNGNDFDVNCTIM